MKKFFDENYTLEEALKSFIIGGVGGFIVSMIWTLITR